MQKCSQKFDWIVGWLWWLFSVCIVTRYKTFKQSARICMRLAIYLRPRRCAQLCECWGILTYVNFTQIILHSINPIPKCRNKWWTCVFPFVAMRTRTHNITIHCNIYYTGCIIMPIEYVGRAFRTSSPTKKGTHFIHLSNAQLLLKTSGLVLEKCEIKLKNCDDSNKNGFFAVSDEREKLRYWKFSFSTQLSVKST